MRMERRRFDIGPPDWGEGNRTLLILCALGGVVAFLIPQAYRPMLLYPSLAYPWSLATAIFLTPGMMPFIVTAIMLWMFGNTVEGFLGKKRHLQLFVLAGVAGNLAATLYTRVFTPMYGGFGPPAGASYSIGALFFAWAFFHKEANVRLMFLVPINAWLLVYASLGMGVLGTAMGNAGSFGGLFTGLGTLTYLSRRRHGSWNPFSDLENKAHSAYKRWQHKRKSAHLQVLKGGKDDAFVRDDTGGDGDGKPPVIH